MRDPACGYTLVDDNNEEYPCDAPAPSWRWYQDVEHEDCLSPACERHENAGGIRMAEMADEIEHLRAERDQWKALWKDSVAEASAALEALDKTVAASQPRRIETVEELDALRSGTVIRDASRYVYEKRHTGGRRWDQTGWDGDRWSDDIDLPATVLYTPEEEL